MASSMMPRSGCKWNICTLIYLTTNTCGAVQQACGVAWHVGVAPSSMVRSAGPTSSQEMVKYCMRCLCVFICSRTFMITKDAVRILSCFYHSFNGSTLLHMWTQPYVLWLVLGTWLAFGVWWHVGVMRTSRANWDPEQLSLAWCYLIRE